MVYFYKTFDYTYLILRQLFYSICTYNVRISCCVHRIFKTRNQIPFLNLIFKRKVENIFSGYKSKSNTLVSGENFFNFASFQCYRSFSLKSFYCTSLITIISLHLQNHKFEFVTRQLICFVLKIKEVGINSSNASVLFPSCQSFCFAIYDS